MADRAAGAISALCPAADGARCLAADAARRAAANPAWCATANPARCAVASSALRSAANAARGAAANGTWRMAASPARRLSSGPAGCLASPPRAYRQAVGGDTAAGLGCIPDRGSPAQTAADSHLRSPVPPSRVPVPVAPSRGVGAPHCGRRGLRAHRSGRQRGARRGHGGGVPRASRPLPSGVVALADNHALERCGEASIVLRPLKGHQAGSDSEQHQHRSDHDAGHA